LSVLTVHKFYNDFFFKNKTIYRVLDIDLKELNLLEKDFLEILEFSLAVSSRDYKHCLESLECFFVEKNRHHVQEAERTIESQLLRLQSTLKSQKEAPSNGHLVNKECAGHNKYSHGFTEASQSGQDPALFDPKHM